jgi:hypothetical protein
MRLWLHFGLNPWYCFYSRLLVLSIWSSEWSDIWFSDQHITTRKFCGNFFFKKISRNFPHFDHFYILLISTIISTISSFDCHFFVSHRLFRPFLRFFPILMDALVCYVRCVVLFALPWIAFNRNTLTSAGRRLRNVYGWCWRVNLHMAVYGWCWRVLQSISWFR